MTNKEIQLIVNHYPSFRDKLFCRGFLLTDAPIDDKEYPFYGNWSKEKIGKYQLLVHRKQTYYVHQSDDAFNVLVGHAYNPVDGEYDERNILLKLVDKKSGDIKIDYLNQLTGIFTLIGIGGVK